MDGGTVIGCKLVPMIMELEVELKFFAVKLPSDVQEANGDFRHWLFQPTSPNIMAKYHLKLMKDTPQKLKQ